MKDGVESAGEGLVRAEDQSFAALGVRRPRAGLWCWNRRKGEAQGLVLGLPGLVGQVLSAL